MINEIAINNRRYIGCKTKLLPNIEKVVDKYRLKEASIFADIFAGTGVVGSYFANKGFKTILNDTLFSNYVVYKAYLGDGDFNESKLLSFIEKLNSISATTLEDNYFSNIYGNKYFHINDAKKIGFIRDFIEDNKNALTLREYYYLITSLIYCADKIANTVGHFESFLNKPPKERGVTLKPLAVNKKIIPADIFKEDANNLVRHITCDVAYVDPPYNARQYVNFYHVLENLARWEKPTLFEGNSMKFKRDELKSDYCRNKAPQLFKDLISNIKAKIIIVSYNNTYKAGSISSVNTISEEELIHILSDKGKVQKISINYNAFNAGKTELTGHMEYLYVCEVDNENS